MFKLSLTNRSIRFSLFGRYFGVQGPVFGRPYGWYYSYNDGWTAFKDLGPIRFSRFFYRENGFVPPEIKKAKMNS